MSARLAHIDWATLLIAVAVMVGVLLTPYDLLRIVQRRWQQRQQERIARGEDVIPKRLPYDDDDEDQY